MVTKLIETQIEDRDGATWVTGLCPACWERIAARAPSEGSHVTVDCPNGHPIEIAELRSAGRRPS